MKNIKNYNYENEQMIINAFKEILKPKYGGKKSNKSSDYIDSDFEEYKVIMPWLKENDYYIEEFPNAIQNQIDLKTLGYDMIRRRIQNNTGEFTNSVSWADRRILIDALSINKRKDFPAYELKPKIKDIIRNVSTGKGELDTLELDEQIALLNNTIEYLLKEKSGYKKVSSEIFYSFIEEKDIKKFRKDTHIFRHGSNDALEERHTWSNNKKKFYIRLGIIIITNIYNNNKNTIS